MIWNSFSINESITDSWDTSSLLEVLLLYSMLLGCVGMIEENSGNSETIIVEGSCVSGKEKRGWEEVDVISIVGFNVVNDFKLLEDCNVWLGMFCKVWVKLLCVEKSLICNRIAG